MASKVGRNKRNNPNKLYVLFAEDGSITSYADNNKIFLNGTQIATLSAQQRLDIDVTEGDIISADFPIIGAGEVGSTHFQYMPEYMKGRILQTTIARGNPTEIKIYGLEATTVAISVNGGAQTTVSVAQGAVATYTNNANGAWLLESDGYILAQVRSGTSDPHPFVWGCDTITGFASNQALVSTLFAQGAVTGTAYGNINNVAYNENGVNWQTVLHSGTRNYEHPNSASHMVTDEERAFSHSYADSDGGTSSTFLPTTLMGHTFILPHGTEFVSFINRSGKPIEKFSPAGVSLGLLTPTKTNANILAPYAFRDGVVNGQNNLAAGTMYVGEEKMYVVYQTKESTIYSSDDDETVLLPTDLNFKP